MATAIIPARFASTRFPGKLLAPLAGRPLIHHVIEAVRRARSLDQVLIATDDTRIRDAVVAIGATAIMTRDDHESGTDRIAEAAAEIDDDILVNVQGDEPGIAPATIDSVVELLKNNRALDLATAATPFTSIGDFESPHRVKVVCDSAGKALYFSRAPIPCAGTPFDGTDVEETAWLARLPARLHVGLYAYRKEALARLVELSPSPLERTERLEQLRALQAGLSIGVTVVDEAAFGIDTPEDLEAFERRLGGSG